MTIKEAIDNLKKEIQEKHKEAEQKQKEAEQLERLFAAYPDLERHVGRWQKVVYASKQVNDKVKRFDIRHNCGCCKDSPLEVWPYLDTEHGKIYSNPPKFVVGERDWIAGDVPFAGWKDEMKEHNIPDSIIGAIKVHFQQSAEERRELVEEYNYDDS